MPQAGTPRSCSESFGETHILHLVAFVKLSHNLTISQLIMNKLSYGLSFAIYTIEFAEAEVPKAGSASGRCRKREG